jgi:hypothetical protein
MMSLPGHSRRKLRGPEQSRGQHVAPGVGPQPVDRVASHEREHVAGQTDVVGERQVAQQTAHLVVGRGQDAGGDVEAVTVPIDGPHPASDVIVTFQDGGVEPGLSQAEAGG